jgi:hypothetical protein
MNVPEQMLSAAMLDGASSLSASPACIVAPPMHVGRADSFPAAISTAYSQAAYLDLLAHLAVAPPCSAPVTNRPLGHKVGAPPISRVLAF